MMESEQQQHCKKIAEVRSLNQKNAKQRKALAKSQRKDGQKTASINKLKLKLKHQEAEVQRLKEEKQAQINAEIANNKINIMNLGQAKSKMTFNLKEQNRTSYLQNDQKIAVLRYIRLGIRGYLTETITQKQTFGIVLPSEASVRVWKAQMILKLNIAKIGAKFDGSKPMNHVIQWKKNNGLKDGVIYDATIQIYAAYINQQCCQKADGSKTDTMTNRKGEEAGIRYIFGFVLVLEKDVPALPLFLQTACDGCARQAQLDAYFQLCNCLHNFHSINVIYFQDMTPMRSTIGLRSILQQQLKLILSYTQIIHTSSQLITLIYIKVRFILTDFITLYRLVTLNIYQKQLETQLTLRLSQISQINLMEINPKQISLLTIHLFLNNFQHLIHHKNQHLIGYQNQDFLLIN
ncbi:Hypothetical_protein [Hexamita inflata]|uniref:Hypothetical_protein n=1 Tax=Hexamita inflata TaxID=28002 RepID=A0AA86UTE2_9EUKA|nr:Hypothetical protein HINF_LOCUS36798 [Hexamita inflata]